MKTLDRAAFEEIRAWVHRNARPIDMALWRLVFEQGDRRTFLDELRCYQNADGGFGHALEADNWNPDSTPAGAERALTMLTMAGIDPRDTGDICEGLVRYLSGDSGYGEHGWQFGVPSNNDHPHAIWWTYKPGEGAEQNIGLTASLTAFALRCAPEGSVALKRARRELPRLKQALDQDDMGDMGAGGHLVLMTVVPEAVRGCEERILAAANRQITRDTSKWTSYSRFPSDFIHAPQSPLYKGNEDIVNAQLDFLIDTRPTGGVWDIPWHWYDEGRYANEFALSRNWWRGVRCVEHLQFLRAFGRLAL